jgi:hypothetical protein
MLDPSYTPEMVVNAAEVYRRDGIVVLQKLLTAKDFKAITRTCRRIACSHFSHPMKGRYAISKNKKLNALFKKTELLGLLEALTGKKFSASLMRLNKGDYTLLHKDNPLELGPVAFFDCSPSWKRMWGGYIGVGEDAIHTTANSLVLINMKSKPWFIKRVNHYATHDKVIVVLRAKKMKIL